MDPSELLSVRLFKRHITEYLPDYSSIDDQNVLQTLQQLINLNVYESAQFLKQEIQGNGLNFEEVLEEYVLDLADHYVQNPECSDLIIEQLLKSNYLSFASKVQEARELQIVIQRHERKRLKELLVAHYEQQDAEDLRIAFERLERKELKERLQAEEKSVQLVISHRSSFSVGMLLRVAAILVVILIPAGIILFRNMSDSSSSGLANGDNPSQVEDIQYAAAEDISGLLEIDLPVEDIKNVMSEIDSDLDRGQGYASEDDSKIEIRVVSKSKQLAYLQNKIDTIGRKMAKINTQIKQGTAHKKTLKELEIQIRQLQAVQNDCRKLYEEIKKDEMHYEFTKTRLTIYSNKEIDPKRFSVREEINVDTRETEYFLLLDEKEYKKLNLLSTVTAKAQKSMNSSSAYSKLFSDINRGEKLLCFYAPGCEHCITIAKELNQLKKNTPDFPEIRVCFMDEEIELIPSFFKNTGSQYPYRILNVADFWETLGSSMDTPAVIYLKNGKVIKEYSGFNKRKFDKVEFGKIFGIK